MSYVVVMRRGGWQGKRWGVGSTFIMNPGYIAEHLLAFDEREEAEEWLAILEPLKNGWAYSVAVLRATEDSTDE